MEMAEIRDILTELEKKSDPPHESEVGVYKHDNSPACIACCIPFNNEDDSEAPLVPAWLPDICGGDNFICESCLARDISLKIKEDDVMPWIRTPALSNNQHVPTSVLCKLISAEELYYFASVLMSKKLKRNSNWVACQKDDCLFGYLGDQDVDVCGFCSEQQHKADTDPYLEKMIEDGTMRSCPDCNHLALKDFGICNVIQCGECK